MILVCLAAALAAVLSGSATASNGYAFGQNVDPSLVSTLVASSSGQSGNNAAYHVLVFGPATTPSPDGSGWRDQLPLIGAQSATLTAAQIAQLSSTKGVQYITEDTAMAPTGSTTTVSAAQLATVYPQTDGAPALWSAGDTGAGVGIAVIDSGVTPRADFGSRLVQVELPAQDGTALNDSVGHGSAVAGVAAGQSADGKYIGVAPGATVYAINVARADGVYTSDVVAGINWVLQNADKANIRVVNLSLSETTPSSYFTNTLDAAVDQLWKHNIAVVVSSGNFGPNTEEFAPANDPWVITVGASDTNDTAATGDDSLAQFSSFGTTPDGFQKPEIVAPGRHIVTTIPASSELGQAAASAGHLVGSGEDNYVKISGTSFSAPQVTGAVALMLQARKDLNPNQVKWLLTTTERTLPGSSAGALDLGNVAAALAHPGNANGGLAWTSWARAGETTNDFLNALSVSQPMHDTQEAATRDAAAQTACAKAAVTLKGPAVKKNWTTCAQQLDTASTAWDKAAHEWADANLPAAAAATEKSAAGEWQAASSAWTMASNPASSAADAGKASTAATQSAAWDSAAWDSAAWDHSAAWDSAAWDSAAWDSAAWDSAAWDSAAWDSAAWDSAAWD